MTARAPVVLHLPGSMLKDNRRLKAFYGKLGAGLAARGADVVTRLHDRDAVPAEVAADQGFHIVDHGRFRHPRVLNAGLSYVQPWYYLDPWGMRAFSSLAGMAFDPATVDPGRAQGFRDGLYRQLAQGRRSRYEQPAEVLAVPEHCIAVFLQTETHRDVGELCHLTLRQMVKALIGRDDPRPIVIKTHPRDMDLDTLGWLVRKARKDSRLQIIPANIHDILAVCDVVVTINSAVGFEAMMHRKPVVLCGQADFHHCAVTLRDRGGMDAAIAAATSRDWPHDAYLTWFFDRLLNADAPDLVDRVIGRIALTGYDVAALGLG